MSPAPNTPDTAASQLGPLFGPTVTETATALAETYTQYWLLPAEAPVEEYRQLYHALLEIEARLDPVTITDTLTEAATAFHRDTDHCPFCRERGPLHLALAGNRRSSEKNQQ
jgi:hypothetical protein